MFNQFPKRLNRAEGMYYYDNNDRKIMDGFSGLWCVNAGHGQKKIFDTVTKQMHKME